MQKSLERIDVLFAQCNCNSITDCSSQLSIFVSFCSERAQGPLRSLRTAVRSCEALLIGCNANSNRQTSSSSVIIIIISHHKIKSYSHDNHLIEAFKHYLHSSFLCWIGSRMARLHRSDIQQLDTHTQSHVQTSIWNRNQCNGIPLSRTWQRRQLVLCILIFCTGALIVMTSGLHRTKREKKPNMLLGGVRRSTLVGGSANRHRRSGLCCRITATFATRSMWCDNRAIYFWATTEIISYLILLSHVHT